MCSYVSYVESRINNAMTICIIEFKFTITTKYKKLNNSKKLSFVLNNLLNDNLLNLYFENYFIKYKLFYEIHRVSRIRKI